MNSTVLSKSNCQKRERKAERWDKMESHDARSGGRAFMNSCWRGVGWLEGLWAILSKWFLPTRLETRTKESKTNASMVVEKPTCEMKVIDAKATAASTDRLIKKGLSESVILRTRKMVNYACVGWSQGKLWWRLVAILTCKLFVKHWYRGERLIEPSSSWFPPKFPSG